MIITSRQNKLVAHMRALMRERKARLEAGEFAVEGEKLFYEAVNSGLKPKSLLITEKYIHKFTRDLYNIDIITDDLAQYIADTKTPQGLFFTLPLLDKSAELNTIYNSTCLIVLDGIQDPGNTGAVIRSCDAFGIDGLMLGGNCADIHSPKVIRSAMGSAFRLPMIRGGLSGLLPELRSQGFTLIAASLGNNAHKLTGFTFPPKCAVVIGGEGSGISADVHALCEHELYIPIKNAESLNAAVAASIIIYELSKGEQYING